jgi:hypothetical protein
MGHRAWSMGKDSWQIAADSRQIRTYVKRPKLIEIRNHNV